MIHNNNNFNRVNKVNNKVIMHMLIKKIVLVKLKKIIINYNKQS